MKGFEFHPGVYRGSFGWMTNDGLALVGVGFAAKDHPTVRADIEGIVSELSLRMLQTRPSVCANGHREERFVGGLVPNQ
jgi:hypothetical protein